MTNHLAMWHYWMLRDRNRPATHPAKFAGHTEAEKEAFDRRTARLRAVRKATARPEVL